MNDCTCNECCYARKHPQLGPVPHASAKASVPCDCCGGPAPRTYPTQEWGFCDNCKSAGCMSLRDGNGGMYRGKQCPLNIAILTHGDVVMCLHCDKPLHKSEPLTYVNNSNPSLGGCHARCVEAYYAARRSP